MLKSTIIRGLAGLAAVGVLGIAAACAPATAATDEPVAAGPTESAAPLDPSPATDEPTEGELEPTEGEDAVDPATERDYAFGETVTYADGLQVTVSKPKSFKPGEYAATDDGDKNFVKMDVTVKNGTDKRFDPSLFTTTATTGERDAGTVFDDEVGGSPDTKVLKGHQVKFTIGYGVDKGKPFVLEVSPDFDHDAALYVS